MISVRTMAVICLLAGCESAPEFLTLEKPDAPGPSAGAVSPATPMAVAPQSQPHTPCITYTERKGTCSAELNQALTATPDPDGQQVVLTPFTLADQCELFPKRRQDISECVSKADCMDFATCLVQVMETGWTPLKDADLCTAAVTRMTVECPRALADQLDQRGEQAGEVDPNDPAPPKTVAATWDPGALLNDCESSSKTRARVGACMMEYCEPFAGCLLDVAGVPHSPKTP